MGFCTRTVEDIIVSRLSRVINVDIGIVPHAARADIRHGFSYSHSERLVLFQCFHGLLMSV